MNHQLLATFAILALVMALLIWDKLRYDLVASGALVLAIAIGVVPPDEAFVGFSDEIVILVASALVVSAAVEKSGIVDRLITPLSKGLDTTPKQVALLAALVAALSAVMKNIGALAIFLPIAIQMARRHGHSPARLLMPLSFASLLGGIITMIGTSPNIIVSRVRADLTGEPFGMFSFSPLGLTLSVIGVAFLTFGWRLLPHGRATGSEQPFSVSDYTAEVRLPKGSPFINKTVDAFEDAADGEANVCAIIREGGRRYVPAGHWWLFADDVLVLRCDATVLKRLVAVAKLEVPGAPTQPRTVQGNDEHVVEEAVITEGSALIGSTAHDLKLRDHFGLTLVALSRRGRPVRSRLRHARLYKGDLAVFQGRRQDMSAMLGILGCLPLAHRSIDLSRPAKAWVPLAILAVAMALAGSGIVPVATAFFAAAVAMVLTGALKLADAYERIEWPILILIACLIPISEALQRTGGTELIAGWMAGLVSFLPPVAAVATVLVATMAVTPFLNNAATVLVLAPIAATLAARMDLNSDAFLMAVAIGAACDFLTPIGHQCNTLVMGPGGYRFSDYWRLGLPLSLMVAVVAPVLIVTLWPV